jgi:hypothetical protein
MRLTRLRRLTVLLAGVCLLAACQIEANTPMRAFDIKNTAQTAVPVPVTATLTATFASKAWCQDEGAMAISALGSANVPIRPVSCTKRGSAGGESTGVFELATNLVKTAGAANPQTVVEEVLNDDLVRFAVFPHGTHKHLLSVGMFLNIAKLEAAKAELLRMPVFQEGGDSANIALSFTITVSNDLPTPAKFYLGNVSAGGDLPADEAVMTIPPGGMDTITLDPVTQQQLMQQGWVNFFAMDAS